MKFKAIIKNPYLKIQNFILVLFIFFLLVSTIFFEAIGRQYDLREITRDFETMNKMINKFNRENSEDDLIIYLDSLLSNNQVKFSACY
ncbi:MAG: hypothetical protein SCK28_12420, partial [Bacillota bacterium]|nr:hypothetical protein [Bacillota bacterium]